MEKKKEITFIARFIRDDVCSNNSYWLTPFIPLFMILNPFNYHIFIGSWILIVVFFFPIWLLLPANPNINATSGGERDSSKAAVSAIVGFYLLFALLAIVGRLLNCNTPPGKYSTYGGGLIPNMKSLFPSYK